MSIIYRKKTQLLADYAQQVLSNFNSDVIATLNRRQVPTSKIVSLESVYQIEINLEDQVNLILIQAILKKQIEAVAEFLRDFHIAINGQRTSIFQIYEVEIKVKNYFQCNLSFLAGKLSVELSYWQMLIFGRYLSTQRLKNYWNQGKHLPKSSPLRQLWWYLNPLGEFRYNLRANLWQTGAKQATNINKLLSDYAKINIADETSKKNWLSGAIEVLQSIINEDKLGINLAEIFLQQDEETLVKFLHSYQHNLTDSSYLETIIDAVITTINQVISQEKSKINVKMFGFVNVGNYHRIDVELNFNFGNIKKYLELVPREVEIKAVLFGFVNVYTVDDITVKAKIISSLKIDLETAACERSLQDLQLI